MTTKLVRLVPLSGIAFVLTMIAIVALEGDEVPEGASSSAILAHWADRSDTRLLMTTLAAFAALFLVTFAGSLRSALRAREHAEASASAVVFGGGVLAAGAVLVSGFVELSASRAGGEGDADAVVALDHLAQSTWVPLTAGLGVMLLAAGVGSALSGALPKALAWTAVPLGLLLFTPGGLVGFLVSPVWIAVASVVGYRRSARGVTRAFRSEPIAMDGSVR
jgi:hypothetical protein